MSRLISLSSGSEHISVTKHYIDTTDPNAPWFDLSDETGEIDYAIVNSTSEPRWSDNVDAILWVLDSPTMIIPGDIITCPSFYYLNSTSTGTGTVYIHIKAFDQEITSSTNYGDYPAEQDIIDGPLVTLTASDYVGGEFLGWRIATKYFSWYTEYPWAHNRGFPAIATHTVRNVTAILYRMVGTDVSEFSLQLDDENNDAFFAPQMRYVKKWRE